MQQACNGYGFKRRGKKVHRCLHCFTSLSLVASLSVSFFFSHLLLYLYTLVTKVLLFYLSAPVTFSYGGLKCYIVICWVVTCLLPNCVSTAPGCLPACSSATLFKVPFLKITPLGIDEDFKQCPFALPSSSSCFFARTPSIRHMT